jgi:abhydrolase domain-containing protein 14
VQELYDDANASERKLQHGLSALERNHCNKKEWRQPISGSLAISGSLVLEKSAKVNGIDTFYREVEGRAKYDATVLLLHGAAFSSKTWADLHTLSILGNAGFRVVAVDLPGFGNSARRSSRLDKKHFLSQMMNAIGVECPVLVSPSMSGAFSLPFVLQASKQIAGFVPIAPVGGPKLNVKKLAALDVPTLVVWGEKDQQLGKKGAEVLLHIPNSQQLMIAGGSHAAYMDQPELFNQRLVAFASSIFALR